MTLAKSALSGILFELKSWSRYLLPTKFFAGGRVMRDSGDVCVRTLTLLFNNEVHPSPLPLPFFTVFYPSSTSIVQR